MQFVMILQWLGLFLLGCIVGFLATVSVIFPVIGRVVLRVIGVVMLGLGTALAIWPTVCLIRGEPMYAFGPPPPGSPTVVVGESYGWSGCLLVIGGLTLGFSFLVRGRKLEEQSIEEKKPEQVPHPSAPSGTSG